MITAIKKELKKMGFTRSLSANTLQYDDSAIEVQFSRSKDHPVVVIVGETVFPGAETIKDIKDLMFMYYGEDEYTKRFGHMEAEIVEVRHSKKQMMDAFDAGFQSADPRVSGEDHNITSEYWYNKYFG